MNDAVPLRDVCTLIVDCEHKTAPTQPEGIPSVRTTDIADGRLKLDAANRVSEETYREWTARAEPQAGDIVLAREAPVGEVGVVPDGARLCLGQRTVLIRPNTDRILPRYLLYRLMGRDVRDRMAALAGGSTVAHLNMSDIRALPIPKPPTVDVQKAALYDLDLVERRIDAVMQLLRASDAFVSSLLRARLIEFADPADVTDSDGGPLPQGWHAKSLGEVVELVREREQAEEAAPDSPYVGLDIMPRGRTILTEYDVRAAVTGTTTRFQPLDILFGKLRPYFRKVAVASVSGSCSAEILVLRPREQHHFALAVAHFASQEFIDYCVSHSTGTKMPRSEWRNISGFAVAVPPADELLELSHLTTSIYAAAAARARELQLLNVVRAGLVDALFAEGAVEAAAL